MRTRVVDGKISAASFPMKPLAGADTSWIAELPTGQTLSSGGSPCHVGCVSMNLFSCAEDMTSVGKATAALSERMTADGVGGLMGGN